MRKSHHTSTSDHPRLILSQSFSLALVGLVTFICLPHAVHLHASLCATWRSTQSCAFTVSGPSRERRNIHGTRKQYYHLDD